MSKKFALVVGIANYLHLKKLDGSIIDASLVANQLQQNGYRVFATLHDCDAGQVTTALSKYSNEVADGDQFLFYFSGHGAVMQIDGVKQYGMYFLRAYEEINEVEVLSLKNLLAYSKKLPKWKNVDCAYIFDACRSDLSEPDGKIKRSNHQSHESALGTEKLFHQYAKDFGVSIVSSCSDGKVSQELPKNNSGRKGGLFTVGLLDVWNERIESGKSMVLEPDSLDSVQKRMAELHPAAAEKDPQQPFMAGSSIVLSEAKKSASPQATPDVVGNAALQSNRSLFDLYLRIGQLDAPMGECARDILNNLQLLGESTEKLNELWTRYQNCQKKYPKVKNWQWMVGIAILILIMSGVILVVYNDKISKVSIIKVLHERANKIQIEEAHLQYQSNMGSKETQKILYEMMRNGNKFAALMLEHLIARNLIVNFSHEEIRSNSINSIDELNQLMNEGNSIALAWQANVLRNGLGGKPKDEKQAFLIMRRAADSNLPYAQLLLGYMYSKGQGVSQDDKEAVQWYRKVAEQGYALGQNYLGTMYRDGRGVSQDDKVAVQWYRKAAEQGNELGQFNLGWMYQNGRGISQDDKEAEKWYRKAAEQGDADAIAELKKRGVI